MTADLPSALSPHAPEQGYYAALLRRLLASVGVTPEFHFLPPLRAYEALVAGRYDAGLPFKRTPERERSLWFSEPFNTVRVRLFRERRHDWAPESVDALRGELGCSMQGLPLPAALQAAAELGAVRVERVPHIDTCFRMLEAGRVRYVVTGEHMGWAASRHRVDGGRGVDGSGLVLAEDPVHLAFARRDPASARRLALFNRALADARRSGQWQRWEHEWLPRAP